MDTQPLAYMSQEFLESGDARPLRIMAEYVEPLRVLHALDLEFYGEHITMTLTILTSTFAALSILLVMIGVGALRSDKTVSQRLDVYLAGESTAPITLEELELSRPFSERVIVPLITFPFFCRVRVKTCKPLRSSVAPDGITIALA